MIRINSDTDYYRRNLPHLQNAGKTYFVTFRLAGSLPAEVIEKMKENQRFSVYDGALDGASTGPTWLKNPILAQLVYDHILAEALRSYHLDCFTIMSNHVHIVLSPMESLRLDEAMRRIKQPTAFHSNQLLHRSGPFWQRGSYDRIIRVNEWERIISYILNNPVKAGLVTNWRDWPYTYLAPDIMSFG
ncbi:MAG TPA: transposase [Candidatus Kapabacteria bacterium]|nr:transposase [Candidatus Kapabacteria bacterium]